MYCPSCGLENSPANQFCRTCGTDLRPVRFAMTKPDAITASAATARDEIGRALADKIKALRSVEDLSDITENVLPEIEKFLESPEERRLRRLRTGALLTFIGFGAAIGGGLLSFFIDKEELFLIAGLGGLVTFFIGIAFLINGFFLSVPRRIESNRAEADVPRESANSLAADTNELILPEGRPEHYISVTDATTRHLKDKETA